MDHEVVPCQRAFFHGLISKKKAFFKPFGPWLSINQMWTKRSDHALESGCANSFLIYVQKGHFGEVSSCLTFSPSSSLLSSYYENSLAIFKKQWKFIKTSFLCHDPLIFATTKPLLPLPLQNPLDHDNVYCRPENKCFGDLKFHGHSFFFFFSWCNSQWSWDKFNNQLHILKEQGTNSWSLKEITP